MTALHQEVTRAWGWNNTRERKLKISLFTKHRKRRQRVWITKDEDRVPRSLVKSTSDKGKEPK